MKKREITNVEYIEILIERLNEFRDRSILELTDEEISEFVKLKNELAKVLIVFFTENFLAKLNEHE